MIDMELTDRQIEYIQDECSEVDVDELYDDMLNECCCEGGMVRIGMLEYEPAQVLKEVDPTAYRCGKNDYLDSLELVEIEGVYYWHSDIEDALEEFEEEVEEE